MGTRRLRLYVVAYLRGLLKPYYDQGNLSIVREELVLNALSEELDNESKKLIYNFEAIMAQHVKNRRDTFEKLYDKILDFRYALEFDDPTNKQEVKGEEIERLTNDPEIDRLIHTVNKMTESGEWDEWQEKLEKEVAEDQKVLDKKVENPFMNDPDNPELIWQWGSSSDEEDNNE